MAALEDITAEDQAGGAGFHRLASLVEHGLITGVLTAACAGGPRSTRLLSHAVDRPGSHDRADDAALIMIADQLGRVTGVPVTGQAFFAQLDSRFLACPDFTRMTSKSWCCPPSAGSICQAGTKVPRRVAMVTVTPGATHPGAAGSWSGDRATTCRPCRGRRMDERACHLV